MKEVPLSQFSSLSEENFLGFLRGCHEEALRDGEEKIVSISLPVGHLDPLAVLESIYEEDEPHFYCEQPQREFRLAAAESVAEFRTGGADRFREVQDWAEKLFARSIYAGEADLPMSGPRLLGGFTFLDEPGEESLFPGAYFFLPRWQVAGVEGAFTATANLVIGPDENWPKEAQRVWAAHAKFSHFSYASPVAAQLPGTPGEMKEAGGARAYQEAVAAAVAEIRAGDYEKVVLARALDVSFGEKIHPLAALNHLRERYPACFNFSFSAGKGVSFLGATPERLLRTTPQRLHTEAIAGSIQRGRSAVEDATLAGQLMNSAKDRHEHQIVVQTILKRLRSLGLEPQEGRGPRLLTLSNVHHLRTPVEAARTEGVAPLDVLQSLHPTPAVGGKPLAAARAAIPRLEAFARGLYAGTIGHFNAKGESDFLVAIRAGQISGERLRLYAGAGIVADSDPRREWQETELKFKALREAFGCETPDDG